MSYLLFLVLIIIVSILLILVIMVQNPKGGGLSSAIAGGGGGSQSLGGVQNTTNFLDKSTWTLASVLFALILLSNFAIPRNNSVNLKSATEGIVNDREILDTPAVLDTDKVIDSAN